MTDRLLLALIVSGSSLRRVHDRVIRAGRDRGDVPGWVLITVMTAGLVVALWAIAGERLETMLETALDGVENGDPNK